MSIGWREFLFLDDGTIRYLPQRVAASLPFGGERLPQYANQSVRSLTVYLNLKDGKPVSIRRYEANVFHFDETGNPQRGLASAGMALLDFDIFEKERAERGAVVNIAPLRARQEVERRHRWQPTDRDITRIIEVIWPNSTGRPEPRPAREAGITKRKRPMTYEGEKASTEILVALSRIDYALTGLDEKGLRGLQDKLIEYAADEEPGREEIMKGVVEAVRRHTAIRAAWKRKGGRWIVVAMARKDLDPLTSETDVLERLECDGRDAAVKVGRELLQKHAAIFDVRRRVEVGMWPAIAAPTYAREE